MIKQIFCILYVSFVAVLLFGCYESKHPILDKGEKINLKGSYKQTNKIDGSIKKVIFTEQKKGVWPFVNYSYRDQDGDILLFKKLESGLYLLQKNLQKEKRFEYLFVDFIDNETALILYVDLANKEDYIDALLKKFNIESERVVRSGDTHINLKSDGNRIIDFFDAHDKSLMYVILKLEKIS